MLGLAIPIAPIASIREAHRIFADALPVVRRSQPSLGGIDGAIVAAIEDATAAVVAGEALALVTNPIAKRTLSAMPLAYPGHTAFLGKLAERHFKGSRFRPTMMLVADELKVVPVTVHIPLSAVAGTLSITLIADTLRATVAALTQDFGIPNPRIAVTGLNPHAGEDGLIGTEEASIIAPAIAQLVAAASPSPVRIRQTRCFMRKRETPTTPLSRCTMTRR